MTKKTVVEKIAEVLDTTPTVDEAKQMFADNPGLWAVETTEGLLTREGALTVAPKLTGE